MDSDRTIPKIEIPASPCPVCRGRRFWYKKRPGGAGDWICAFCYPPQDGDVIPVVTLGVEVWDNQARENYRRMAQIMSKKVD